MIRAFRKFLAVFLCLLVAVPAYSCANDQLAMDSHDNDGNTMESHGNGYAYNFEDHLIPANVQYVGFMSGKCFHVLGRGVQSSLFVQRTVRIVITFG